MIWAEFLKHLKDASTSVISITGYCVVVVAYVYRSIKNQPLNLLFREIKHIPEADRKLLIETQLSAKIGPAMTAEEYLKSKKLDYKFWSLIFIGMCLLLSYFISVPVQGKKTSNFKRINGIIYEGSKKENPLSNAFAYISFRNKNDSSIPRVTGSDGKFFIDIDTNQDFRSIIYFGIDSVMDSRIFNSSDFIELHVPNSHKEKKAQKDLERNDSNKNKEKASNFVNNGNAEKIFQGNKIDTVVEKIAIQ